MSYCSNKVGFQLPGVPGHLSDCSQIPTLVLLCLGSAEAQYLQCISQSPLSSALKGSGGRLESGKSGDVKFVLALFCFERQLT